MTNKANCCNGNCNQGRDCPARKSIRWPLFCTRCGSLSHYAEECKVPAADQLHASTHERAALLQAFVVIVVALIIISYLEGVPV